MDKNSLYLYAKPTRFGTSHGLLLVTQMIDAAPPDLSGAPRAALLELIRQRDAVALIGQTRVTIPTGPRHQQLSGQLGNRWGALRDAVVARARLEPEDGSGEATAIARALFARGLSFTRGSHVDVWAFSTHLLGVIEAQKLAPRIDAIVGEVFLTAVREAHEEFGRVMTSSVASEAKLGAALEELSIALAEYGRQLLGWLDWGDPAKRAAFATAVAPLDAYRRTLGARKGLPEEPVEDEPTEPVTPIAPVAPSDPVTPVSPMP